MTWAKLKQALGRMDWTLILTMLALLVFGITFIYSASYRSDDIPAGSFFEKQIVWALLGLGIFMVCTLVDYHHLRNVSWGFYALGLVLLVLVLLVGKKVYGAYRWLNLFGIQIQPSEFAKLTTLLALARFLSRPGRNLDEPVVVGQVLLIVAVPFLLILKEPDLGSASVLIPLAFFLMYAAGVPLKTLLILVAIGLLLMPLGWFALGDYQKERILVFLDPGRDPLGAGWNNIQSEIAVGSGGFWGKGYLKGTQNLLGFLPRTVAPTDFIYSVVAEEMGFAGSVLLLALYAALLTAGIRAALVARDKMGRLLAVGVTSSLFCHVTVNMAMTIGLLPITGIPLPLLSYGGSFMISTMVGLGIVQSVYVRRFRR
ncbi:MAG TPA: rod shape-determining protein RodA [Verrucomicrobia bacterium]|nr:MAG: rod shape-determining protein RodA [Lentisphaerae bacterium GWF2_57_35]HBA85407.1 rod shape-determining protein RodA [Verrucomicrobiota bacterium]